MPYLTHANGAPVVDNTNTQTAGPRGQVLPQDIWLLEKLAQFDREVIPDPAYGRGVTLALERLGHTANRIPPSQPAHQDQ